MKQVQLHGIDDVRLVEVPAPQCGAADIIVDVEACGICGSDLGYIRQGGMIGPGGSVMALGHEFAGTIRAVGDRVQRWRIGQRVTVSPMTAANLIGNGGSEGGFAPQVRVREADLPGTVLPLPQELSVEVAALAEPLSVAMHAIGRVALSAGSKVVITGAGPIGLCCVLALKARGVEDVVVVDPAEFRRATAIRLGADAVFAGTDAAFREALAERHGTDHSFFGMPLAQTDIYFECSGVDEVLTGLLTFARPQAEITLVAAYKHEIPIDVRLIMAKELRLSGSLGSGDSFPEALAYLSAHADHAAALISHRFKLEDFDQALAVAGDPAASTKVLVMP